MLKPAKRAIAPSTISTNSAQVRYNVPISVSSGLRLATPYRPTVKAIAPPAPSGASFITSVHHAEEHARQHLEHLGTALPSAQMRQREAEQQRHQQHLQQIAADEGSTKVFGTMCRMNSVTDCSCARVA